MTVCKRDPASVWDVVEPGYHTVCERKWPASQSNGDATHA
jgi:hypothetical protein